MSELSYDLVDRHKIDSLCQSKVLNPFYWVFCSAEHTFALFYEDLSVVGAVELDFHNPNSYVFIHMIEVCETHRLQGIGYRIVKVLQRDIPLMECHPIPSSERLFTKCGFSRCKHDPSLWEWVS